MKLMKMSFQKKNQRKTINKMMILILTKLKMMKNQMNHILQQKKIQFQRNKEYQEKKKRKINRKEDKRVRSSEIYIKI